MKYLCVLLILTKRGCFCWGMWEYIFGPALSDSVNVQNMVTGYGYKLTEHEVTSETGHIIILHKMEARKRNISSKSHTPAVLIQHGLLGASDNWLLRGPERDLPYMLSDAGYDVWLGNMRGNVYSRRHRQLDPDSSPSYWNYGLHEISNYDLPATIDYILDSSGQENLFFIGHSIGSTIALILCSSKPEYNKKIIVHLALAPITYVSHTPKMLHKIAFTMFPLIHQSVQSRNIHEVLPRRKYFSNLIEYICHDGSYLQKLCLMLILNFVGVDYEQFNTTLIPRFARHYPAGTSLSLVTNLYQLYTTGTFSSMNFKNSSKNVSHYNNATSSIYNFSEVTHPISIHYSEGDYLVTEEDINPLAEKLSNVVNKMKVPYAAFNHLDFMWANDAKNMLYNYLLDILNKYMPKQL